MELESFITENIRETLKLSDEALSPEANLIEYGLHSLAIMQLVNTFQKVYDLELNYVEFASMPTIKDWVTLLHTHKPTVTSNSQNDSVPPQAESHIQVAALSDMQYAFWAGQNSTAVSAHLYVEFDGHHIQQHKLNEAICRLMQIHPMLRVSVSEKGEQTIRDWNPDYVVGIDDLREAETTEITEFLMTKRHSLSHQKLAIEDGQVIDFSLTLLPEQAHKLHIDVNMLAADAPSILQIYEDLAALYEGYDPHRTNSMEYFVYLQQLAEDEAYQQAMEQDRSWWQKRLAEIAPPPQLPVIAEPLREDNYRFDSVHHQFSHSDKQALTKLAEQYQISLSTLMLTLFSIIIGRWSSHNRFRLNLPIFERKAYADDVKSLVGDFTHLLIFNAELFEDEPLCNTLQRFEAEREVCMAHSAYSGIHVLRDLSKLHGDTQSAPIVYTCGLGRGDIISESVRQTLGEPVWCVSQGPMVDLDVQVAEHKQGMLVNWDFRTAAFKGRVIQEMFESYLGLIQTFIHTHNIDDMAFVPALPLSQRQNRYYGAVLLDERRFRNESLHAGFWRHVESHPDKIAIVFNDMVWRYSQLAELVTIVTTNLKHKNVQQGECVLLSLQDPIASVVLTLATLTLGANFIKLGPGDSESSMDIYQQSESRYLITDNEALRDDINIFLYKTLVKPLAESQVDVFEKPLISGHQIAFSIADSQSDKLIAISHQTAVTHIKSFTDIFELNPHTCLLSLNAHDSKQSLLDVFSTFAVGGSLFMVNRSDLILPLQVSQLIEQNQINTLHAPSTSIAELVTHAEQESLASLALVLSATENVSTYLFSKLREHNKSAQLVAMTGTEHAIFYSSFSVCHELNRQQTYLPFGRALPGIAYKVKNEYGQECPDYVLGQLWISGNHLFHHYPFSTGEKLVNHTQQNGLEWYNTGDFAYYLPDGSIQLCRTEEILSHQGYMIEQRSINALMAEIPGVLQASVEKVDAHGEVVKLAAVLTETDEIRQERIQQRLSDILPRQLLPDYYFIADSLPIKADGNIDSEALLTICLASEQRQVPSYDNSALLEALTYIFANILGIEANCIKAEDDFFDSGGDSLLATHLVSAINQYFKGSDLTIVDIFTERTPLNLTLKIREKLADVAEQIAQVLLKIIREKS